ncbi:MAG: hypothetical protein ACR2PL_08345 [Dehalococcoidia bacterium]
MRMQRREEHTMMREDVQTIASKEKSMSPFKRAMTSRAGRLLPGAALIADVAIGLGGGAGRAPHADPVQPAPTPPQVFSPCLRVAINWRRRAWLDRGH